MMRIHPLIRHFGTLPVALILALVFSPPAHATRSTYGEFDIGAWKFNLKQEGFGQSASQSSDVSLGFQVAFGIRFSQVFLEYTPQLYRASVGERPADFAGEANDATYWSLLAGNIGVRLPVVPVDVYVGAGAGVLDFTYGADSRFSGSFWRAGAGFTLVESAEFYLRAKAEYQSMSFSSDNSGSLPGGLDTRGSVLFVGLCLGAVSGQK